MINAFKLTSSVNVNDVRWVDNNIAFIDTSTGEYCKGGKADKCAILDRVADGHRILIAWPGRYSQDVFVVDNPDEISAAIES
jgi:hypothetical protein